MIDSLHEDCLRVFWAYLGMHFAPVASTYCGMAHPARSTSGLPTDSHPVSEGLDVQSLADLEYRAGLRWLCPDIWHSLNGTQPVVQRQ